MQHAVGAAILPFPNEDRVRAVIFVISTDLRLMEPEAHAGRDQKPGSFNRGDRRGDRAFAILEKRKPRVFVRDLHKEKPRTWAGSGVGYRTFITVPIGDQSGAYGLLTLDAPEPGVLTDSDVLLLELIAQMLSVVFASAAKISPSAGGSEGRPRGG